MKQLFLAVFLSVSIVGCSQSVETEPQNPNEDISAQKSEIVSDFQTYSAETFFETTSIGLSNSFGYSWSFDGSAILVHSDSSGVFNVSTIATDGQQTPLSASKTDAQFAISFFPNDDRVFITADKSGNERFHLYVRELDGTLIDILPDDDVRASFAGWRGDGKAYFVWHNGRDSKVSDLYEMDVDSHDGQMVFKNSGFQPGILSRSGRWLAFQKQRTSADSDIYIVDRMADNSEPVLVTAHKGNIAHAALTFTPDETKLVYKTDEYGEFSQAWTHDLTSGVKAPLVKAEWDVSYVSYSPSGLYQVHAINADGQTDLTITNIETGKELILKGVPDGEFGQVRFSRDDSKIAFGMNTDTAPLNIYMMPLEEEVVRLTNTINPDINEENLVPGVIERFEASDGVIIPGIMYRPKMASAEAPVPALVFVHGGPGGQSRHGYDALIQHLVNQGYAIFAANNRGSSGYGKTFNHMDDKRHGQDDLRDIVEAGQYLRSLDWVDGEKVGVIGGSYGGFLTAAALAFYPEEFEVGVNIFGVTNWVRTLQNIPEWWEAYKEALFDEMGDPATDADRHRAISPLFHAQNIVKPMLVVQGANDPRVLQVESDELVAAIRENGVPVKYVLFPDEGHGFRHKKNRITASEAYLSFLDEHLKGE